MVCFREGPVGILWCVCFGLVLNKCMSEEGFVACRSWEISVWSVCVCFAVVLNSVCLKKVLLHVGLEKLVFGLVLRI